MRFTMAFVCLLATLILFTSTGCSIWRQVSRPELWGLSLPETWRYDSLRASGKSHLEARQIIRTSPTKLPTPQELETVEPQTSVRNQVSN